jgi:hypothetical protein
MSRDGRGAGIGALLLLSLCLAAPAAAQTIGTTIDAGGYFFAPALGPFAVGQTFVAPGGNRLTAFSFEYSSPDDLVFRLAEWNGGALATPYLFSQAVGPTAGKEWVSFHLPAGGVPVSPGIT